MFKKSPRVLPYVCTTDTREHYIAKVEEGAREEEIESGRYVHIVHNNNVEMNNGKYDYREEVRCEVPVPVCKWVGIAE